MREIIQIQIGQCGNQISSKFWDMITDEHEIDSEGILRDPYSSQNQRVNVYFNESGYGRQVPRSILVDLEPGVLEHIRASPNGRLYRPENFINGTNGAGNNWAKGHYTDGTDLIETIMDTINKEVEACDCLQGFQLSHSMGGGTGSGLGTLIYNKLSEEYPDRIRQAFSVFPSTKVSDVVVAPYNCIFAMSYLLSSCDFVNVFDNDALYDICNKYLKITKPTYGDINHLVSNAMSGTTASLRFPGQLNADLRKLGVNLIPFPRLHFLTVSLAPLTSRAVQAYQALTVNELGQQLFDPRNVMCAADPRQGKYLTAAALYRGLLPMKAIEDQTMTVQNKNSQNFVNWISNNITVSCCDVAPKGMKSSATLLGNTTVVSEVVRRIYEQFNAMWKRKAFVHYYSGEGMDEMEFTEAESNVLDLISEYENYQNIEKDDAEEDAPVKV